jgi:hypothetical protein
VTNFKVCPLTDQEQPLTTACVHVPWQHVTVFVAVDQRTDVGRGELCPQAMDVT